MQAAVVGDVVPGAHHQSQLLGHRLAGLHRLFVGSPRVRVLQRGVIQRSATLEGVMPTADEENGHLVGDHARQHRARPHGIPERPVERGFAAGDGVGDQRPEVVALIAPALAYTGKPTGPGPRMLAAIDDFQRRVDDVEQPVDPTVGPHRAQVRRPAHRRCVAVEVARRHHREDRFERRIRPDSGGGEQLVDRQVGHPEHADPPVGVGQLGCPVDELNAVLRLPWAEHLERTV